ncbi:MAG: hypothetical protein JNL82_00920 [Myxococcales bacterium]|nr:hypothetical protein [Myxococcales bacterium]
MRSLGRWLLGLALVAGCDGVLADNWVEVDLAGTDQTWNMYPDSCTLLDANTVSIVEGGYDGAALTLAVDPLQGSTRVGIEIPPAVTGEGEPVALWLSASDACETFAVAVTTSEYTTTVQVDLACELPWVGVWTSLTFVDC